MTTREDVVAETLAFLQSEDEVYDWHVREARNALAAADAHDAAHGVHRVSLDDATVERAARANFPLSFDKDMYDWIEDPERRSQVMAEQQDKAKKHVREILAAAVGRGRGVSTVEERLIEALDNHFDWMHVGGSDTVRCLGCEWEDHSLIDHAANRFRAHQAAVVAGIVAEAQAEALREAADDFGARLPDGTGNGRAYNSHKVAEMLRARADRLEGK